HDRHLALGALGRDVVGDGRPAAAAAGDRELATADHHVALGLDAVASGGDADRPVLEVDVPLVGAGGAGLQPVAPRVHRDRAAGDDDVVLAPDAVVGGVDRHPPAGDDHAVLAGDAVLVVAADGERPLAGDGQVGVAEQGGVRFVGLRVGIDVAGGVGELV